MQTVCTVTVNSANEKEAFARHLPPGRFRFVELVEPGRRDWLASACQSAISCDVLVISGHFDGSREFFSDRTETQVSLPVAELERVACSDACPGLLSRLKEVHLYGCNTLNPRVLGGTTADLVRSLVRRGDAGGRADARLRQLGIDAGAGESSRERMRRIFEDVPVIYGFSSVAPLGPVAGATLENYFREHGAREIGSGRASAGLLAHFAAFDLDAVRGHRSGDAGAQARDEICLFSDDRVGTAQRIVAIHRILRRPVPEVMPHLGRIEAEAAHLAAGGAPAADVRRALDALHDDLLSRARFLAHARQAPAPALRARMLDVAGDLGWLTAEERKAEWTQLLRGLMQLPSPGLDEVDLACARNPAHAFDGIDRQLPPLAIGPDVAHAAIAACLGNAAGLARVVQALGSGIDDEVLIAGAYLRHRPLQDADTVQRVLQAVAALPPSSAQVQALDTLGREGKPDAGWWDPLLALYARTPSAAVQSAIAGILVKADLAQVPRERWLETLVASRRPAAEGNRLLDLLIQRLRGG